MSDYLVFDLDHEDDWKNFFLKLPYELQDIYFTPEYYKLYKKNGDALCFVFQRNGEFAMYPFLRNRINNLGYDLDKDAYDIQGVYGYNGIISTSNNESFITAYFKAWSSFCTEHNIITEFLRVNPFFSRFVDSLCAYSFKRVNTVYATNLCSSNILYDEYEHSTRKNIKHSVKSGLITRSFSEIQDKIDRTDDFLVIYYDTMQRTGADDYYRFSREFFSSILSNSDIKSELFMCYYEDVPISTEIVLKGSTLSYSFLGGTLSKYYPLRPNDFLKHAIIQEMKTQGFKYFLLGGGVTDGDGISRYKKSFAKNGSLDFRIGYKIHNTEIYNHLTERWRRNHPDLIEKYGNRILCYRELV